MTDQPTPTPRTDAAEIDFSCETLTIHTRYVRADFARELERELAETAKDFHCLAELLDGHDATECRANLVRLKQDLAACVPGMELIARMLSDERALADMLAGELRWRVEAGGYGAEQGKQALAAWKEARREA